MIALIHAMHTAGLTGAGLLWAFLAVGGVAAGGFCLLCGLVLMAAHALNASGGKER